VAAAAEKRVPQGVAPPMVGGRRSDDPAVVVGVFRFDEKQLADHTLFDQALGGDETRRIAADLPDHQPGLAGALGGDHGLAVSDGQGHRLFAKDMLTPGQGGHGHLPVQLVRRADHDSVDRVVVQQLAVVLVHLVRAELLSRALRLGQVKVANGRQPGVRVIPDGSHVGSGHTAGRDHPVADTLSHLLTPSALIIADRALKMRPARRR